MPMQATTGTKPSFVSVLQHPHVGLAVRDADASRDPPICPSTERCGGAGSESPQRPSAPVSPTAGTPACASAATNRVLIVPASTATTASSVGSSVMRSPSTCRFSMPACLSAASISLPPPWTITTGSQARLDDARHRGDDGLKPRRIVEQLAAELDDDHSDHSSPRRSSTPSMTFMFCTAWPDAPFSRLSMTETRMTRPDGIDAPPDVAEVRVRDVLDLGERRAGQADERLVGVRRARR